ncbi:Bicupin, oxalate decarboxylase/oxidase [Stemphylium lycopersici]|uniref:Bicupin, oxalate decarboxylase/oxidase n=1 Tax=Stemphylium lycopersici TaxID=183478 RepID=A0A364MXN7_STELY|nr:Bicupin, oxalate decarboxylase/oxidase [Stemphylium lycopersici]RAR06613.1 Bicupin, oxalate decarboxylase/oxidase [Stemphylium lycopersici]
MRYSSAALFCSLAGPAFGLPAPQASGESSSQVPGPVDPAQVLNMPLPSDSSGKLRGSENYLGYNPSNPVDTKSTVIPPEDFELAPGQSEDAEVGLYIDLSKVKNPQPIRGGTTGPTEPGPRTQAYDRLNSDLYAPPGTDKGEVSNAKWPFGLSHNRHGLAGAGWARSQNTDQLPISVAMAGTNMRLSPHAYRELHWHKQGEWALMLNGSSRIASMNEAGQSFVDDVQEGDVWFFPPGIPHSIQAFENGCEFLLIFNDGSFSEENTFLLSELMMRNPESVVAKNFKTSVKSLEKLPKEPLWIFPGTPAPKDISEQNVTGPAGVIPKEGAYTYHWSQQEPLKVPGGTIKILDPATFPIASTFSAALITVEPGAMRELHWHTTSDEWSYFLRGSARLTVYEAPGASRTFDFAAGDVGYVPVPNAHYLENVGNETLVYLEVLQSSQYSDISVNQWLGITPKQIVKDHLNVDDKFFDGLSKEKEFVIQGNTDLTTEDFTPGAHGGA